MNFNCKIAISILSLLNIKKNGGLLSTQIEFDIL